MKNVEIELNIKDEKNLEKLMAKALAEITRMRIEELPEHLRVKAYDRLIEKLKDK